MDAQFDETNMSALLNSVDIERERRFDDGRRETAAMRSIDETPAPDAVRIDLQRLLPARRRQLSVVPRAARAAVDGAADASDRDRVSHAQVIASHERTEQQTAHRPNAPHPFEASRDAGCLDTSPPTIRRVAVHAMKRTHNAATAECYGVFLYDADGGEHAVMHFDDAVSATYTALRLGQTYRIGVEFSNFSDPKTLRPRRD